MNQIGLNRCTVLKTKPEKYAVVLINSKRNTK